MTQKPSPRRRSTIDTRGWNGRTWRPECAGSFDLETRRETSRPKTTASLGERVIERQVERSSR